MSDRVALRLLVSGRVQGVGYRAWLEREAVRAGVRGWVRNRHDGRVEALCIGTQEAVAAVREACAHGPAGAHVTAVEAHAAADETVSGFTISPTM